MSRRFQFSLKWLFMAMLVVCLAGGGLAYLSPKERLMTVFGLLELAAWNLFVGLPFVLVAISLALRGREKWNLVFWILVAWVLAFAYTIWPMRIEPYL